MKIFETVRVKNLFFVPACFFLCLLILNACRTLPDSGQTSPEFFHFKTSKAVFNLSNNEKFAFTNLDFVTDGDRRILAQFDKTDRSDGQNLGKFISLSADGGKTFGAEKNLAELIKTERKFTDFNFSFVKTGFAVVAVANSNMFYLHADKNLENWSNPVQINDEQDAFIGGINFLQSEGTDLYCVWMDNRRGFQLIFFSSSRDGGKTWSPNQPIEYDFREGRQSFPHFVFGANDRLLVFWEDWRDRKTLVDIRFSYSDDKGETWIPSRKLNDDEKEVWQISPGVAAFGANIYAVFADFSEEGEENDNDWNIYFSRSTDGGETWEKSGRLNDIKEGVDTSPSLTVDKFGNIFCLWRTTRETLFGQIAFSYSSDQGKNWSPSVTLTDKSEMVRDTTNFIKFLSPDKLLFSWVKEEYETNTEVYSFLEKTSEPIISAARISDREQGKTENPLKYETGETLFFDDFSSERAEKWKPETGFWNVENKIYMGVSPNNISKTFVSFADFEEPESYVWRGNFKLDPVAHTAANIYFRTDKTGLRHFVITNFFRLGTWLSLKDDELPNGLHLSGGKPLVQKRFPFQKDRWYQFTLVVTPDRIDYYVEGRLMLSFEEKLILPPGKIGIGGLYSSPTYFDEISVSSLK